MQKENHSKGLQVLFSTVAPHLNNYSYDKLFIYKPFHTKNAFHQPAPAIEKRRKCRRHRLKNASSAYMHTMLPGLCWSTSFLLGKLGRMFLVPLTRPLRQPLIILKQFRPLELFLHAFDHRLRFIPHQGKRVKSQILM